MGTAQVNSVINAGGAVLGSYSASTIPIGASLLSLVAGTAGAIGIYRFQKMGGTTQGAYQVTTNKTFYCIGMWAFEPAAGGAVIYVTLSQSTGVPGQAAAVGSPPAGSIYYNGDNTIATAANIKTGISIPYQSANTSPEAWVPLPGVTFSATYYPYIAEAGLSGQPLSFRLIGYEA